MDDLHVGCRIERLGDIGTVKFIGIVPPTSGEWIGVEWDDPTRGKHDGSKDGVQYFSCKNPTGGSFVRAAKIEAGISVIKAIQDRYTVPGTNFGDADSYFTTNAGELKMVEAIGMDKVQKQFEKVHELKQVGLRNLLISSSGTTGHLLSMSPNIVELDLSKNLLSSWGTVCEIAQQLKFLRVLSLSENVLAIPEDSLKHSSAFDSVHTLVLNKCRLSWADVLKCSVMWKNVTDLHVASNAITEITSPKQDVFTCLTFLNLSENKIASWDDVRQLDVLPKLTTLFLNDCGFSEIDVHSDEFRNLKHISLSGNMFKTLQIFNEINKFPSVDDISFRKNPVFELEDYPTMQEIIIAKIRKLVTYNRSEIDETERRSAELDYLRKYGMEWRNSGGNQDPELDNPSKEFMRDHPRFYEIIKEYGAPQDYQLQKKSTAIKGNLIEVVISAPVKPEFNPVKRRLPLSMTVGNLKLFIQKLTKIEIRKQRLVYVSKDNANHVVPLKRDAENLNDVSIEPGDIIQVLDLAEEKSYESLELKAMHDRKLFAMIWGPR